MTLCDRCVHWNVCGNETCYDDDAKNALQRCADFLEVVRCKDCEKNPEIGTQTKGMVWCRRFRKEVHPHGFCSYGVVRKG